VMGLKNEKGKLPKSLGPISTNARIDLPAAQPIAVFPILADLVKVKVKRRISLFVDNYDIFS